MNKSQTSPVEFYQHETTVNQNICDHFFKRLSLTRVICSKCKIGFYDDPFNPFPVEQINKRTAKERKDNNKKK
jgi:hypothetical protein